MWEWLTGLIWLIGILALIGALLGQGERESFLPLMRLAVLVYILQIIAMLSGS